MAFDVLRFYRTAGVKVDKSVYLTITDATGLCGASEEAIAIAEMVGGWSEKMSSSRVV